MQAILNFHWTEKKERELYSSILLSFFIQRELKLLINLINQIKPQADILAYQHLFFSSTISIQSCPMNILPTLSIFSYKNTHTHTCTRIYLSANLLQFQFFYLTNYNCV